MANELETPDFGNFSIQSTIEGAGNQELLNDLLAPETSIGDPDDIKGINEPDPTPAAEPQKKKAPAKAAAPASEETEEEEDKDPSKGLSDFLFDDEEEEEEEENTSKTKAPAEATADEEEDEDQDTGTQFTALAKDLFKLGVFTADEEDEAPITTAEEFLERFNKEKKQGAAQIVEDFIGQFGEDYQNAFQAIFVKGVDPKEYFGTYNAIQNYADMDLSSEANQIAVIKQGLMDQGFDPEDIETEVERVRNYGDLETVATKFHKVLVKKEATKLQQLEQNRERELRQQALAKQQYSENVANILQDKVKAKEFDGIPLNPKLAQELQDFLVADKWKTSSGETLTDFDRTILELKRPENHEKKVKIALLLKILEKDPTLSTIQKAGITKKTDTLFGEVARQATKTATKSGKPKPTSWWQQ